MTKTLNQFLEGYLKVKSSDEQKFVDKHVAVANPDRNGNGDDVFKGAKVKTINRRKERKGYDSGDDAKVYEEAELDEALETERVKHPIGQRPKGPGWTLKFAGEQTGKDHNVWERKFKRVGGVKEEAELEEMAPPGAKYERMVKHIKKGYAKGGLTAKEKAIAYATAWKAKKANEEVEELDELSKDTLLSYTLKAHSRGDMASRMSKSGADKSMANYANKRYQGVRTAVKKLANEEAEQIDELSKKTLGSYIKKAGEDRENRRDWQDYHNDEMKSATNDHDYKDSRKLSNAYKKDVDNRNKGIKRATKKIANEETLVDILSGLKESHIRTMVEVYESLNEENQAKFVATCKKDGGIDAMLNFSIKNRGE